MPLPPALRVGDADTKIRRRVTVVTGDWHLWIYCCNWSLRWEGRELAHSESPTDQIDLALSLLNGQEFERVTADTTDGSSQFYFDLGCVLATSSYDQDLNADPRWRSGPYEQWLLYQPSGVVLSIDNEGRLVSEPGDKERGETRPGGPAKDEESA